jgi:phosphoserine phosphatase
MPHPYVLVLTANPTSGALDEGIANRISALTDHAVHWRAPGAAIETPAADASVRDAAEAAVKGLPIDVNLYTANPALRAKKLLISDMDSTMIEQEVVDELAMAAGRIGEIAAMTEATMRGELDFKSSLRHRVGLLAGLTTAGIGAAQSRITLMPGATAFVAGMKTSGATTALVSVGSTAFVEPVAKTLGFDRAVGNVLEIENGHLTGRVAEPILAAARKLEILHDLATELGLAPAQVLAVGDGANDVPMLQTAGLGVAFRAKPAVRAAMRASPTGAVIDHADLTALLHLQGL